MTVQKRILKFWAAFGILLAVAIGVITLIHRWHRVFPSGEASGLYLRYENVEGVEASFVKNYKVNDTIAVDVTLLEATDSAGWARMKEDFGITDVEDHPLEERELVRELYNNHISLQKASPDKNYKMPDTNICNNDIITCERAVRRVAVFHTANLADQHGVSDFIYDLMTSNETLNIKNYEESI
jgi:hypothetical protein